MEPLPRDYEARSASDKLALLWQRVSASPYPNEALPTAVPGAWGRRVLFSVGYNRASFEHPGDELPPGRQKPIHRYGSTARVQVAITAAHPYTGVFATGGAALARLSDAVGGKMFAPSIAIKFPVDGKPSLNYFGLPAKRRAAGDRNFLSGALANSTPPADKLDAKLLGRRFQATARALGASRVYPIYLPLHELAESTLDGRHVTNPVVPDRLELHPTDEARAAYRDGVDWRLAVAALPVGLRLFELRAASSIDEPAAPIGELTIVEPFVASPYGDERLFFQHHTGPTGGS